MRQTKTIIQNRHCCLSPTKIIYMRHSYLVKTFVLSNLPSENLAQRRKDAGSRELSCAEQMVAAPRLCVSNNGVSLERCRMSREETA
jgi:hypothetical protein